MTTPTLTTSPGSAAGIAPRSRRHSRLGSGLEWLFVLAAPGVVFLLLGVRAMAPFDMIDPGLYTGFAQHGRDLILRYGIPHYDYFWVRVAFIFPAHLAYVAFGPVGGFYAFRYTLAILATGPAYLLFRRLRGPATGAVAVLVILSSPVVLLAWGTDYPDSSAISYLIGGIACLVMPAASASRRRAWIAASGVLLASAVHSQFVSLPLVLAVAAGYLVMQLARPRRDALLEAGVLLAGALAITALFVGVARLYFGHGDLILPTLRASRTLRSRSEIHNWHSTNWRWALYVPYVLVPLAVLAAWVVARARQWKRIAREELTVAVIFGLQVIAYYGLQFGGGRTASLEYHLFSSMLWSGGTLTLAFLITALGVPLLERTRTLLVPALVVVVVPLIYRLWRPHITLRFVGGLVLVGVIAALSLPPLLEVRSRAVAGLASLGVVAAVLALTVAVGPAHGPLVRVTPLPKGQYAEMLGGNGANDLNVYRVASDLIKVVPPATHAGEDLLLWYPPNQIATVNEPAAEYLWHVNSLQEDMPKLSDVDAQLLQSRRPHQLVMLSATGQEFGPALDSLAVHGYGPRVLRQAHLHAGSVHLTVAVVNLEGFATPRPA